MNTLEAIQKISSTLINKYEPHEAKRVARFYLEDTFNIKKNQPRTPEQQGRLIEDVKLLTKVCRYSTLPDSHIFMAMFSM